jgi:hypothetical protein
VASDGVTFVTNFVKFGPFIQKVTHTGNMVTLISLLAFPKKGK